MIKSVIVLGLLVDISLRLLVSILFTLALNCWEKTCLFILQDSLNYDSLTIYKWHTVVNEEIQYFLFIKLICRLKLIFTGSYFISSIFTNFTVGHLSRGFWLITGLYCLIFPHSTI